MSKRELLHSLFQRARNMLGLKSVLVGALLAALVLVPLAARAQFGLDPCCAIISAGLNSISGLLKSVVGKPLSAIQQLQQQATSFEQQIVYALRGLGGPDFQH